MCKNTNYLSDALIYIRERNIMKSQELNNRKETANLLDVRISAKTLANMDSKGSGILDHTDKPNRLGNQIVYTKYQILRFLWYTYSEHESSWIDEHLKEINMN